MKKRDITAAIIVSFIIAWILASLIDTNIKNIGTGGYAPWNIFAMMDKAAKAKGASKKQMKKEGVKMPGKLYSESNVMLLARLIEAENGSAKHDETLILTRVCVLKRVKAKSYPNTIKGVICHGRAYSTAQMLNRVKPSERSIEIAEELLIYGVDEYPDNLVFQAQFKQGRKVYKKVDGEYFCLA